MMFDKRLFSLADGVGRLIAAKVACQWLGLVANIAFVVAVVRMLQPRTVRHRALHRHYSYCRGRAIRHHSRRRTFR